MYRACFEVLSKFLWKRQLDHTNMTGGEAEYIRESFDIPVLVRLEYAFESIFRKRESLTTTVLLLPVVKDGAAVPACLFKSVARYLTYDLC